MIALKALEFTNEVNKERNMKVNGRKTKGMDEEKWNEVRKNIILELCEIIGILNVDFAYRFKHCDQHFKTHFNYFGIKIFLTKKNKYLKS